ncbi:hypothetical protein Gogos_001385, partial [Gossypium gossypioides]|nr:hypothetical protein [Gossypium gossypioides]
MDSGQSPSCVLAGLLDLIFAYCLPTYIHFYPPFILQCGRMSLQYWNLYISWLKPWTAILAM